MQRDNRNRVGRSSALSYLLLSAFSAMQVRAEVVSQPAESKPSADLHTLEIPSDRILTEEQIVQTFVRQ